MRGNPFKAGHIPWNKKTHLNKVCPECGNSFSVRPYLINQRFCSISCSKMGHKLTPKHIEKIREAHLGKPGVSHPAWNKGLKGFMAGEKNSRWIKDRTKVKQYWTERNNPEYKQWRKSVYDRDNSKCRMSNKDCCGKIVAHHILGWSAFPELRYRIDNGITLCTFHHPRKRAEEARLSPYFQELINLNN